MSDRVFDAPEAVVVEAAHCTWCGAGVGEGCGRQMWGRWASEATHAQRWHDYWNETHGAHESGTCRLSEWSCTHCETAAERMGS